ncbi:p-loop containing nucleoside triphosphate hydrolases superfamily protein [Citrus sinensis]|nr:p-loop containing nucleoside triphosphate hydrolases superfamily protein [Citrus sinensis]
MTDKNPSRRELLDRWRGIEEEEELDDGNDPLKRRRIDGLKEKWFADAFNFLIGLPEKNHIWCGSWDIMGPYLELFYNYFKDECHDSPLRLLWKRISGEMQHCIQCVSQHHQAQEMYSMEYESGVIGPLLDVLRSLDEERVTKYLREINARLAHQEYYPQIDNNQVICIMYEVLMFPVLLDDQSLFTEFETFIEAVDNMHELALDGHQLFPGVFALFFFNRRVRTIGRRLARSMGKLRRATDLEPMQPLLKKFIGFLETEVLTSTFKTSRPRARLKRLPIWLGITSLLEFLEPPALEEGILERYPIFFDTVLNHISGDSPEFSHAVSCLRELFKMLGRSTLSPSVMRNTLLGQCFHTRSEKIHKDIFDLFPPFLQSLEALQDGEHEKQRRHFLYFLLYQVPVSSNFSVLTAQMACKISLLIIHRGYKMNPPCPPFECAHMWGPFLVSSLKDSSLHSSLRQPAFDLIQTIIVSDAAALVTSVLKSARPLRTETIISVEMNEDEDDLKFPFDPDVDEKDDNSSWNEFTAQSRITSQEFRVWMCIPMLWIDVLVDINPSVLPVSFSKVVFWARSHFSIVEPEISAEMALDVRAWLSSSATEISSTFGWKAPTGCDDGGAGKVSKNSMEVSTMCLPLIRAFKRLTAHFIVQIGQGELRKQWTWEPRMGESLILSLVDPNDNVRQFGKCILEQVSNTRGLASGLKFLSSSTSSLSTIFLGLKHALKLSLHHFFFVLRKIFEEGHLPKCDLLKSSSGHSSITMFSSQGGFLRQPQFESFDANTGCSSNIDLKLWEKFHYTLSEITWPSVKRCLQEGKTFLDYSLCQMTCIRVLEILPVVFGKVCPLLAELSGYSATTMQNVFDFKWLHDLVDWGKSQLKVVIVYWKRTITCLLNLLKDSCSGTSLLTVSSIENLISSDHLDMDGLVEKVSLLCVSLSKESSRNSGKTLMSMAHFPEDLSVERKSATLDIRPFPVKDMDVEILDSETIASKSKDNLIVVSDDETEKEPSVDQGLLSDFKSRQCVVVSKTGAPISDKRASQTESLKNRVSILDSSKDLLDGSGPASPKQVLDESVGKSLNSLDSKVVDGKKKESNSKFNASDSLSFQNRVGLRNKPVESSSFKNVNQASTNVVAKPTNKLLKELVCDVENDPLESSFKSGKHQQTYLTKSGPFVPKRQVIQLKSPFENRCGLHRMETGVKRFGPPKLDDWYKPILEIDYFATVGLASSREDENRVHCKLKEVPVCFQSPEQFVSIFRPLVLEEFKAQLHSSFLEMSSWEDMYYGSLSVLSVERVDDFHLVRFVHDDNDSVTSKIFSENDLVLLTRVSPQKTPHDVHMVGKVERRERDNNRRSSILLIRFYLQNGSVRLNQARRNLLERSKWHATLIMSITPQLREFHALSSLKSIPLLPIILNPVNVSRGYNESREPDLGKLSQLQQILKTSFNESQLQAISVAIGLSSSWKKDCELSLIQGPPGTGKTRTIVAIVSALLATRTSPKSHLKQNYSSCINSRPKIGQSAAIARAWQDAALARQINEDSERDKKSSESSVRARVLICAQSNAAVDELVSRISKEGLYGSDGKTYKPYLVRVGNVKTVHPNSLPFFIDTLVDHRLAEERMHLTDPKNEFCTRSSTLRSNLEKLVDRIRFFEAKRANTKDGNSDPKNMLDDEVHKGDDVKLSDVELEAKLRKLYEQKKQIYRELGAAQVQEKKSYEETKALKHKLRKSILKEAEIVVTTLSGCGGDLYGVCSESVSGFKFGNPSENTLFDAVVIDEAAQALEPATLIPLQLLKSYGTRCVMVGDPKQLPATVLSNVASKFLYECSMFERLQRAGHPVVMLTKQYRMHPDICRFPSLHFYENKLLNGEEMSRKSAPFHVTGGLGPYVFYDISDGQELRGKNAGAFSLYNEHEVDAAVELLRFFRKRYLSEFVGGRIGIITPYKSQLGLLRSQFSNAFGSSVTSDIEFNTVDGFQGREVDILILSTVRAADSSSASSGSRSSSIGFVADVRRMNVALTRARLSLWILGNARTLQMNYNWAALVKDAKERNLVISIKKPYASMFKSMFKSSLRKNHSSELQDDHLSQLKHTEKHGDTNQFVKQIGRKSRAGVETKTRDIDHMAQCNKAVARDNDTVSAKREDLQTSRRRARDQSDLPKTDHPSAAANGQSRTSKSVKSAVLGEHVLDSETRGEESGKKKFSSSNTLTDQKKDEYSKSKLDQSAPLDQQKDKYSKGKSDHSGHEAGNSHKHSKFKVSKGSSKSFEQDRSLKKLKGSDPSTGGSQKEQEANDQGRNPNSVGSSDALIAKRKQQREAVDAILYSSLISSKKPEPVKPAPTKRSLSPTSIAGGGIRPPKRKKGEPTALLLYVSFLTLFFVSARFSANEKHASG